MANKYGGKQPIDSLSGVAPPKHVRPKASFYEPVSPSARRSAPEPLPATPKAKSSATKKAPKIVSIELKLPKIKRPKLPPMPKLTSWAKRVKQVKLARLPRRRILVAAAVLVVILLGFAVFMSLNNKNEGTVSSTVTDVKPATPTFDTVLPQTAEQSKPATGFDPEKGVASYGDKIAGINVTVSQQPLPVSFKQDPDGEILKLATNLKATKLIEAPGIKAYTGTSSQDGTQTVIFAKKDLLIFIRATKPLTKEQIVHYIVSLD